MKKNLFQIIVLLFLTQTSLFASHMMGGEITWSCTGSGQYIFKMKFYRDCNGIPGPGSINLITNAPIGQIPLVLISQQDISPIGSGCPTCSNPQNLATAVEEFIFQSSPITLTGTPPVSGWYFYYSDCCRNNAISNLGAAGSGNATLRAMMYAGSNFTTGICNDNSPQFAERPSLGLCNSDTVNYANSALDMDLDSLVYSWDSPLDGTSWPFTNYPFTSGFSFNSPLPSSVQNPANVGATIDPTSGIISFYSVTTGAFMTVTKVSSYKCGQLVSEVFREVQIALFNCPINSGPIPSNHGPNFTTGNQTEYYSIVAGDSLDLQLSVVDAEFLNTVSTFQSVTLSSHSLAFGTNDTSSTSGCLIPPCATLDHPSPYSPGAFTLNENLHWVTACAHAGFNNGCLQHQRTFHFIFRANDNFCPANGVRYKNVIVDVSGPLVYQVGNDLAVSYPGVSIQWYLNGAPIPGATDTLITPTQSGVYTVMATTGSGCQMVSNCISRVMSGLNDNQLQEKGIYLYPNPVSSVNQLNVALKNFTTGEKLIKITDLSGKLVKQYPLHIFGSAEMAVLDITSLTSGTYLLSIDDSTGVVQSTFIIE
jgi:hypothetical protein